MLHVIKHVKVPSTRQLLTPCTFPSQQLNCEALENFGLAMDTASLDTDCQLDPHPKATNDGQTNHYVYPVMRIQTHRILLISGKPHLKDSDKRLTR